MTPNLQTDLVSDLEDQDMLNSLCRLQLTHQWAWSQLRTIYESVVPSKRHRFRPSSWVLIHRHQHKTLEPRWKGPFIVLITIPMVLKVYGITT